MPHFCGIFGTRKNKKKAQNLFFWFLELQQRFGLDHMCRGKKKGLHFMLVGGMEGMQRVMFFRNRGGLGIVFWWPEGIHPPRKWIHPGKKPG